MLKLHNPTIIEIANTIRKLDGIDGVNISLYEVDQKTENVKITINGDRIDFDTIKKMRLFGNSRVQASRK